MDSQYLFRIQGQEEKAQGIHYDVDLGQKPIGEGGMGTVYAGMQINERTGIHKEVAVKFLREDLPSSMIARAEREASIKIKSDNLVEMIAMVRVEATDPYGNKVTRLHVVSELLRGVMLYDLIEKGTTTDAEGHEVPYAQELLQQYKENRTAFTLTIGKKILSGIMALHDAGYIHRDIDPSNIMITQDHQIKLIDFGIARPFNNLVEDRQYTQAGNFLGKPGYAAPELILGDITHQNETTDIYAIGILLFQLFTGHLPFQGPAQDVMGMQRNSKMPLDEVSDKDLRKVIGTATEKSQSKRFHTAAEFRVALEKIDTGNLSQRLPKESLKPAEKDNNGTATLYKTTSSTSSYEPIQPHNELSFKNRIIIWVAASVCGLIIGSVIGLYL